MFFKARNFLLSGTCVAEMASCYLFVVSTEARDSHDISPLEKPGICKLFLAFCISEAVIYANPKVVTEIPIKCLYRVAVRNAHIRQIFFLIMASCIFCGKRGS